MALTATRTTTGFELVNNLMGFAPNPTPYELTPGVAYTQGDAVVLTNGLVAKAAASASNLLGIMAETVTLADNPATGRKCATVHDNPFNRYRCSFSGHRDATATGGTTTTLVDTALATSTDAVWVGALLYVYDGPNAGEWRTVSGYTGATDTITVAKPFPTAITNASKYIILGAAAAAGDVINIGSRGINLVDENTISGGATIVAEAGPLVAVGISPANLTMDVLIRKHNYNA